jgi:hypothetical protein
VEDRSDLAILRKPMETGFPFSSSGANTTPLSSFPNLRPIDAMCRKPKSMCSRQAISRSIRLTDRAVAPVSRSPPERISAAVLCFEWH